MISFDTALSFGPPDLAEDDRPNKVVYERRDLQNRPLRFAYNFPRALTATPEYVRDVVVASPLPDSTLGIFQCVIGVPTALEDKIPDVTETSGFISYSNYGVRGDVYVDFNDGRASEQYALDRTTIDFRAKPDTGLITLSMNLIGRQYQPDGSLSDDEVSFGVVSGETTIDGTEQNFSELMTITSSDNMASGTFGGWFFGPSGAEMGLVIGAGQNRSDGATLSISAVIIGTGQGEFVPA